MMKIVIKEIDRYTSKTFKNKSISEYLIYVTLVNGQKLYAYTEIGDEAKNLRVNELIVKYFMKDNNTINKEDIIEELCLEGLTY
ncbi:MAG: hypothetical protein WCK82_03350 [Bacteroidota bacterium]